MLNWKALLEETLRGLAQTHAQASLAEIQRVLCGVLHVEDVRFHDPQGRELRGDTPLQQVLEQPCQVSVRLRCARLAAAGESTAPATDTRFREGPPAPDVAKLSTDERYELFLREFIRLEERHNFMWAGYVVRELLPRLGFAAEEAKVVLDHLRAENLVTITKVPNPKNPDFPATGVRLNQDHPRIKALLGDYAAPEPREAPAEQSEPQSPTSEPNP